MRALLLNLLLCAASAQVAVAAVVNCAPAPGRFTVLLSEPSGGAMADRAAIDRFLNKLQFELDQERDEHWINPGATPVAFRACPKRAPALDGSEFSAEVVEQLNDQRVLLEVWGVVDRDGTPPVLSAQINYLLVPLRFAADQRETVPTGLQRLRYPEAGAAPTQDAVQLISKPLDLDAFIASALGLKLLRERAYEPAYANLCRASSLLGAMLKRPLTGRSKTDLAALRDFVRGSASRVLHDALADAAYPKTGPLRLQQAAQPCAGAE
ncbi:hypothetical protein [Pelomonas sp. Root1237]|uniref:hypothetical protein n=1 Tax=Pelomonas sp. Root1237 TaxID=1736434 RepID=UPI0006FC02AE|nr:hypothetical protein [Pelomonas sp. Root1237]KQV95552.1 hypothetical protein ASC91_24895 [Pelomonas sp. Root1237]